MKVIETGAQVPLEPRPAPVERALRFIRDPASDRFEDVALDVFAFQFEHNEPYRRFCRRRGRLPENVRGWEAIPPVPTATFKDAVLSCAPATRVFKTSGTTRGEAARGRHHLPELALYEASWEEPFRSHVLPDGPGRLPVLSLVPSGGRAPESSLSFMVDQIVRRFGSEESRWVLEEAGAAEEARAELSRAAACSRPVLVVGTALALHAVLEPQGWTVRLPAGSRLMDTGGFKARRREVHREELLRLYEERLGIPPARAVGEYGMTELCSQFYETVLRDQVQGRSRPDRVYEGPPWVRTRVLDPETLAPQPAGEIGLLSHVDLANAWTVAAVVTEDLGVVGAEGFRLEGRAHGAELRGCSLATEELLGG